MIRINLLPQKRRAQGEPASQAWLGVVAAIVALEVVGAIFLYNSLQEDLDVQKSENRKLGAQISASKKAVKDHARVKERLVQLRARAEAISKLQTARTGPTAVLLEVARLLTPGQGPSVAPDRLNRLRRDNPLALFNPDWDARRLWLTSFVEKDRKVRLEGLARDGEDVSELARRMNLSNYFNDVRLRPAQRKRDDTTKLDVVEFALEAKVNY